MELHKRDAFHSFGQGEAGSSSSSSTVEEARDASKRSSEKRPRHGDARLWLILGGSIGILLLLVFVQSARTLNSISRDRLWAFYEPIVVVLWMSWLWGVTLRTWENMKVGYQTVFGVGRDEILDSGGVFYISGTCTLAALVSAVLFCFFSIQEETELADMQPTLLYICLASLLIAPFNMWYKESRLFFGRTLFRVLLPFDSVNFADFWLADYLTSLAQTLADFELALCGLSNESFSVITYVSRRMHLEERLEKTFGHRTGTFDCGPHRWVVTFLLVLPFVIRLVQCIRVHHDTGDKSNLANALKYFSALPVIILSNMRFHSTEEEWSVLYKPVWVFSAIINSTFSFYWDVYRDWGHALFTNGRLISLSQSGLIYNKRWVYYGIVTCNAVLRVTWTAKISSNILEMRATAMILSLLEVFRRFMWAFLRMEVALKKQGAVHGAESR